MFEEGKDLWRHAESILSMRLKFGKLLLHVKDVSSEHIPQFDKSATCTFLLLEFSKLENSIDGRRSKMPELDMRPPSESCF